MNLVSIPANPVPDAAVTGTIKTPDGVSLRFARWEPPPGRKGTVCLFQGRAEYIEKYFETVRDLRARGFAVATLDWRGQGGSVRALRNWRKGYVRNFSQYQIDLETFIHEVVLPDCPPPVFAPHGARLDVCAGGRRVGAPAAPVRRQPPHVRSCALRPQRRRARSRAVAGDGLADGGVGRLGIPRHGRALPARLSQPHPPTASHHRRRARRNRFHSDD